MLKKERQEKILDLLNRNDYLSIPEISSSLDVSDMTIRRDINELADKSLLVKIFHSRKNRYQCTRKEIYRKSYEQYYF